MRSRFHALLAEGASFCESKTERTPLAKTARTCQQLLKLEPVLWRFAECDGVEPTNNAAERALRAAVIWRGSSFGSQSRAGCDFVERMLSVTTSLRLQGRAVLPFLARVLRSQPVSLLPTP
ncbi:MAG: transposase [Geitlerinemataceae cyanobacterium]